MKKPLQNEFVFRPGYMPRRGERTNSLRLDGKSLSPQRLATALLRQETANDINVKEFLKTVIDEYAKSKGKS